MTDSVTYGPDGSVTVTREDSPGVRWNLYPDPDSESPAEWLGWDASLLTYRAGRGMRVDSADSELSEVFYRAFEADHDDALALAVTRRYARVFCGYSVTEAEDSIIAYSACGYSRDQWWDILCISARGDSAESWASGWEQWARGDVWIVTREEYDPCEAPESCHGDNGAHWANVESVGGIYGDNYDEIINHFEGMI